MIRIDFGRYLLKMVPFSVPNSECSPTRRFSMVCGHLRPNFAGINSLLVSGSLINVGIVFC